MNRMVKLTPAESAEKWGRRLKGSTEDIRTGVIRVTEAPGKKAAEKKGKWVAKMTDAKVQDKWAKRVGEVSLEDWKKQMVDVGIGRISAGVDAEVPDMGDFYSEVFPYIETGQKEVEAMADITLEDSIARMDKFVRHMSKFSRK